jgi:poly(3-hydroxybutyrate) depolymerase
MICRSLLILLWAFSAAVVALPGASGDDSVAKRSTRPENAGEFQDCVFTDADGAHRYVVFVPPGYDGSRRWPVILSLHGAGERGADGRKQLSVGLGPIVALHPEEFPAVIVFPQVEETDERILTAWSPENPDGRRALKMLGEVERRYSIDSKRRILTGWSMGGYGVWLVAAGSEPGFWSAAMSVSGGAPADVASKLPSGLPMWTIHGTKDRIVEPSRMKEAVQAATGAGRSVVSTLVEGVGHEVWRVVYGRDEVRRWLFDPSAVNPQSLDWSREALARLSKDNLLPEGEFRPSAVISRAVALRIGNAAFAELARGIPEAIPPERLTGKVADIKRSLEYDGTRIEAGIRGITWTADLVEAQVTAAEAERLVIRVGLKNLTLHATGGDLRGGEYEASCAPFEVVLGRHRPVWVQVSTRPRVIDGEVHLTEREIEFSIPHDNWFVTEPGWAKARGKGLTPELVKVGVVGGMYRAKDRVEEAVRKLIPPLIERIEERLVQVPPDSLASLLWPLPTSPPRIRLVAEGIRTDSGGVSVTVGLAVEGPDGSSRVPTIPTRASIREGESHGAIIGIAPQAVSSVATVFGNDPGARLDVRDAPDSGLVRLGDESLLREVAPGLTAGGSDFELRTVLSLPQPFGFAVEPTEAESNCKLGIKLHAPVVLLAIARRPRDRSRPWEKCFATRISIDQGLSLELNRNEADGRSVTMTWDSDPEIRGETRWATGFAPADPSLNGDRLVEEFASAWRQWTTEAETTSRVDDLAVGPARLRLNAIPTRGDRIWLEFEPVRSK